MHINEILFWSERDDLENDETSSRDPLGTETFAGQLAELILPGLTTITWWVRYLTLICLWLRNDKLTCASGGRLEVLCKTHDRKASGGADC